MRVILLHFRVCVCAWQAHFMCDSRGVRHAESSIRKAQFDRQLPWALWPRGNDSSTEAEMSLCSRASGFAYKMLLWPDLAFMGNPLNSNGNGLSWQEVQILGAKSFAWCNVVVFFLCFLFPSLHVHLFSRFFCLTYYLFPPMLSSIS